MNNATWKRLNLPIGSMIGAGLIAVCLTAGLSETAMAQYPMGGLRPSGCTSPYYLAGGFPFRSSTAAESFARGTAAVIRAKGEFNLLTSEAAINLEEARARAIVNTRDGVDTYFKIRQMNRDYRRAERGARPTQEELERYAQTAQPDPLSPSELDPLTGRIRWPILLQANHFDQQRAQLEELLDRWAISRNLGRTDGFDAEHHLAFRSATRQLQEELRGAVRELPPQEYLAAQRFLRSLEYQVLQSPVPGVSIADIR